MITIGCGQQIKKLKFSLSDEKSRNGFDSQAVKGSRSHFILFLKVYKSSG